MIIRYHFLFKAKYAEVTWQARRETQLVLHVSALVTDSVEHWEAMRQWNLKAQQSLVIVDLCLKKLGQWNHVIIVTSSFSFSSVFKMFSVHTKTKSRRFKNSSGLKSVFEKLRFRDGLVWTVGLTVTYSCDLVWTGLKLTTHGFSAKL